jgi:outer membrane autotransporter protein
MKTNKTTGWRNGQNSKLSGMAGLLSLALLALQPLAGFGQGVISSSSGSEVDLNSLFSPPINSVAVRPGVTIDTSDNNAIYGDTHTWNLTINDAALSGYYNGVNLGAGGSVDNSGGNVSGGDYGVNIYGKAGSVVNSGSINGNYNDGVRLRAGGSANNQLGGSIEGNTSGVKITGGGAGTVINAGSILGDWRDGVYMDAGGSVNNQGSGLEDAITGGEKILKNGSIQGGRYGVEILGSEGFVTNSGSITGRYRDGVRLRAGGTVDNELGGIWGNTGGVKITGGEGAVINSGLISGTYADGVYMDSGGSVFNFQNAVVETLSGVAPAVPGGTSGEAGTIVGGQNGVEISGGPGVVYNNGSIIGGGSFLPSLDNAVRPTGVLGGYDGVYLGAGGSVFNDTNGVISGTDNGVNVNASPSSVANYGSIYGVYSGVYMGQGSSLSNLTGGIITGGDNGVYVSGGAANVDNRGGSIVGQTGAGVFMNSGGTVVNKNTWSWENGVSGASIEGAEYGVEITGGLGTVINSGTIVGTNNDGVYLGSGGSVDNKHHGTITGGEYGVEITGGEGYVTNDRGTISGESRDGVRLRADGTVDNGRHGGIYGNVDGVHISSDVPVPAVASEFGGGKYGGDYTVINYGTIVGTNRTGVLLENGGNVYNGRRGEIVGGRYGVDISSPVIINVGFASADGGSPYYTVDNSGTISGESRDGVRLRDGGSVFNDRRGDIFGGMDGVHISSSSIPFLTPGSLVVAGNTLTLDNYTVDNYGTIIGTNRTGVLLENGGSVYNGRHGIISGGRYGVDISNPLPLELVSGAVNVGSYYTVENYGSISGYDRDGVRLRDGGSVYNGRSGDIYGNHHGVHITGGAASIINAGTITGDGGTAILLDSYNDTVTLMTGSRVYGNIDGGGGVDAAWLEGHGTYNDGFLNFADLTVQASDCRGGWNLAGNNTFTNSATVESGLLRINGTLNTPLLTVDEGATLGGSGVINGIVDNQGDFTPGNSPGILTINGSMTNGGDYQVQLNPTTNDLILVNGTATITGGDVIVQPDRVIYGSNTVYTILTATNGVSGAYDTNYIEPQFSPYTALFLASSLSNDLDNVYLTLHRKKFTTVANTYNQNSVAGALDGIVDSPAPGMSNLVTEFFWLPDAATARAALDSMSGEIHGTLGMLDVQQQNAFNNSIALRTGRMSAGGGNGGSASMKPVQLASAGSTLPPMRQVEANQPLDIWIQGFGSFGHVGNDGNALGGDYTISGLSGGMDYRVCPELLVGLGLGYSHNGADVGGPAANGRVDAFQIGGYGGYVKGPWHLDGILSYGFLHTATTRFIDVGSIHQEADGSYDGGVFSLSAEGGYAFVFDWLTVEPTVGLDYAHLSQDGFSETGTSTDGNNYGLKVNSVDMDSFRSALGVRLAAQFGKKGGVQFIPALRAAWEHEFVDRYADVNASFIGGSGAFDVRGVELGADSGVLGAGLTVAFNKSVQGFVNYDANLNSQLNSSTISGGLSISW